MVNNMAKYSLLLCRLQGNTFARSAMFHPVAYRLLHVGQAFEMKVSRSINKAKPLVQLFQQGILL